MNKHIKKAAYFLALSLILTGCSSSTPEVEVVEQEVITETAANEETEKTEEIQVSASEEEVVTETEVVEENNSEELTTQVSEIAEEAVVETEETKEEASQTSEKEETEKTNEVAEVVETVETEAPTEEEVPSETVLVETPVAEEVVVETPEVEELVVEVEAPVIDEPTIEAPTIEEPKGLTGTFSATGNSYDDYGWKPSLNLTFENGTITNVNYDEVNAEGGKKSGDAGYLSYFNQQTGVKLDEVYKTLSKDLLNVQAPDQIDSISGATVASDNFVNLAKKIIADNQ